jgi:tetratricopeptide (TPR) repeat protein
MNTSTIYKKKQADLILITGLVLAAFFWVVIGNSYAASTSSESSTDSKSAAQIREDANSYFDPAKKLQDKENYREAARQYEKAVKVDPTYAEAYSNLGYCYRKLGKYDTAVMHYKKAIQLDQNLAEAHEYLGEAYAEMGKFDLAEKELQILRNLGSDEADELEAFIKAKKNS